MFLGTLEVSYSDHVGKYSGCGDSCSRPVSTDDHGLLAVALGGDQDDIVAVGQFKRRV